MTKTNCFLFKNEIPFSRTHAHGWNVRQRPPAFISPVRLWRGGACSSHPRAQLLLRARDSRWHGSLGAFSLRCQPSQGRPVPCLRVIPCSAITSDRNNTSFSCFPSKLSSSSFSFLAFLCHHLMPPALWWPSALYAP